MCPWYFVLPQRLEDLAVGGQSLRHHGEGQTARKSQEAGNGTQPHRDRDVWLAHVGCRPEGRRERPSDSGC